MATGSDRGEAGAQRRQIRHARRPDRVWIEPAPVLSADAALLAQQQGLNRTA
jgi:hypothetical protein